MVLLHDTKQPAPGLFAFTEGQRERWFAYEAAIHFELKLELFPERKIFLGYGGATALLSSCLVLAYSYQPRLQIL